MRNVKQNRIVWALVLLWAVFGSSQTLLANFQQASAYFQRRDFVNAAGAFYNAYTSARSAPEKAKAEWGLAQSLHKLEFYYSASKYYSTIVRRGPKATNPFFRLAMEELGQINSRIPLGQSHVVALFKEQIPPSAVPGPARGFYYYYSGLESFGNGQQEKAYQQLERVPSGSTYYARSLFYMGVIANISGQQSKAVDLFQRVRRLAGNNLQGDFARELANLNIARVKYEQKNYREALSYYSLIPRDSDNWLQALFEASWTFFMLEKHNNTLGTIHTIQSPFFEDRFFPETYILQSVTHLRLCNIPEVKNSIRMFKGRYQSIFNDIRAMNRQYAGKPMGFYKLVQQYRNGSLTEFRQAWAILDSLSRTDVYKEAAETIRFSDRELARLGQMDRWQSFGLTDELSKFLRAKKKVAAEDGGARLYKKSKEFYGYLKELSEQTVRINAELLLKNLDKMRRELNIPVKEKKGDFIGGLQPLKLGQRLEYWPFEGEYWEDELGYYVYNIESKCQEKSDESKRRRR